ncbi:MAG: hypothetical protein WBC95_03680 [Albidovulum sp.]
MRMIGIGLMGFLLAGVALLLSTMNIVETGKRYVRELTEGPQLIFEDRRAVAIDNLHTAVIHRSNSNHPVILSGLPDYKGVVFTLPVDARPTSGYLQIDATFQVLEGVEGVLRISIDNIRRGEMLLRPGEVGRSLQISLSPTDFARDQLVVSFSLQGEGPGSQCSTDEGFEAVVEIETTSAIFLTLDRPLETARDRVNAWGQLVRVAWPDWLNEEERVRRLILATQFKQRDIETVFVDAHSTNALTTVELRKGLLMFDVPDADAGQIIWPHGLAHEGTNAGLRRFHHKTIWRERYDPRNDAALLLPSQLDLHLALGRQLSGNSWSLTVTLNNRLVHQDLIDGTQTSYDAIITLPENIQGAINTFEVIASATQSLDGVCDAGPELVAEMLPSTRLLAGDTAFSDNLTDIRLALSRMNSINLAVLTTMNVADADFSSSLLARLVPAGTTMRPDATNAHIIVVPPNVATFTVPDAVHIWLITQDAATGELVSRSLEGGTQMTRTGMTILVIPSAISLSDITK